MREAYAGKLEPQRPEPSMPVGAENLIRCTDQGRCARKNVGTYRATYVPHSVAPAVRQDPDGDLEILVSNPIGFSAPTRSEALRRNPASPYRGDARPGRTPASRFDDPAEAPLPFQIRARR